MRKLAGNRQMTDVWRMPAIAPWEKTCGRHPTQKPLALVVRAILASTHVGERVLDPFVGSGTTGIAANLVGRNFVGIDSKRSYLDIAIARKHKLKSNQKHWCEKIGDLHRLDM